MGPWALGLVALAALQPGARVLDLACGTGLVTRLAAPKVGPLGQVTGLDLNAGMLAVARSLPPPSGASITWIEGSAMAMDLPDSSFDVILSQEQRAVLARQVKMALQSYADGDGVAVPDEINVAMGQM